MHYTYSATVPLMSLYTHAKVFYFFFFFNDTATTEIYTLSLHDGSSDLAAFCRDFPFQWEPLSDCSHKSALRSEEHTSELQSQSNLVCRLLLEKKKIYLSPRPRSSCADPCTVC